MADILAKICADKRDHVAACKARRPLAGLLAEAAQSPPPRGFAERLRTASMTGYGLIAEIKRASPSRGLIRADFDPAALARAYAEAGAACLSVLTDEPYFQGNDAYLAAARDAADLPALRKDFMLDPYQIAESRALGADCVLLIMAALEDGQARDLAAEAEGLGMDVLVEVHDVAELDRATALDVALIGINNRNLKTLDVDLGTAERLAARAPANCTLVCESGLRSPADLGRMARAGMRCFLIGESLMAQDDVTAATRAILADPLPAIPIPRTGAA
ncbi:MAG: indole-3-glycerol phosphate synthase TrpC [Rhodospirillaceae bacterium]|jgi:indole-3-glycerol phosphate synthase|nr:indole-3-glycerol phosphate synthase TrpC [Rhodospirillaceae bacterium]MBT6116533.1 indole-3-glycerol phosphate synthase TrpC [Rhodospirillaceae bacterium]